MRPWVDQLGGRPHRKFFADGFVETLSADDYYVLSGAWEAIVHDHATGSYQESERRKLVGVRFMITLFELRFSILCLCKFIELVKDTIQRGTWKMVSYLFMYHIRHIKV